VTELSIARSYLEAADADISDMKDQIELLDKAKAEGREPDYVPATSALGGGINTFRTIKKLIPKEEAMVTKRVGVVAALDALGRRLPRRPRARRSRRPGQGQRRRDRGAAPRPPPRDRRARRGHRGPAQEARGAPRP
jgi:hypothetical protein